MGDTFRELQKTNGRKIEVSQEIQPSSRDLKGMGIKISSNLFIIQLSFLLINSWNHFKNH
jgi:hypothetical protein